jgi:hypothetical protein
MPMTGKRLLSLKTQLFAPMIQGAIGDSQIASDLGRAFPTGFQEPYCFFFEFLGVGLLDLAHDNYSPA